MTSWPKVIGEIQSSGHACDVIRRKYLKKLHEVTGRNVILFYSGFLQNKHGPIAIDDQDKNGLMTTIHKMDRSLGLDLLLHTPGGDAAATESIVDYLRAMFPGVDLRAIVPQIAMSAGTMISCACKTIVMGKHSSLGPIDPQIHGLPAHGLVEEFEQAKKDFASDPNAVRAWGPILSQYHPTLIGEAAKAIMWTEQLVKDWLKSGMFDGEADADDKANAVVAELGSHAITLSHARHISMDRALGIGLKVEPLEDNQELQDAVLAVHHATMQTFAETRCVKLIENHSGRAFMVNRS